MKAHRLLVDRLLISPVTPLRVAARGFLAAFAGSTVVWACMLLEWTPGMLSPSRPPADLAEFAIGLPILLAACAPPLSLWLLPVCLVTRFITLSRGVHGLGAAIVTGSLAAVVAFGSIYFFPSLLEWPPTGEQFFRKLPAALHGAAFALTWFLAFELLPARVQIDECKLTATAPQAPLSTLATRTTVETLAIVGMVAHTTVLGGIAGGMLDLYGEDSYRVKSVSACPDGRTKAYIVLNMAPGGAVGDIYEQVYLLPASERWTDRHRGLLLWSAEAVEILDVVWTSERGIQVQVGANDYEQHAERIHAYSRDGFKVWTKTRPGS